MINKLTVGLILAMWISSSIADVTLKVFQTDSINEISAERNGQRFIVILWSIDCPPCLKELIHLQQFRNRFSKSNLVLVATDDQRNTDKVQQILNDYQLNQMDNWIFTGSMPERLRYAIDPAWYGELPRAYFYDESHQRVAYSGKLTETVLESWLKQ